MKERFRKTIKTSVFAIAAVFFLAALPEFAKAGEMEAQLTLSSGESPDALSDGQHSTSLTFQEGDILTVSAADGAAFYGLYIIWDSPVAEWTLDMDNGSIVCGRNGFLHEYIAFEEGTVRAVIHIPAAGTAVSDIRIFDSGKLPKDVQIWQPPCEKADIMLVSAHADDEILFFGGIIPTYGAAGDAAIQVVYMSQFWEWARIREHEKLDGLWTAGLKYYPVSGEFEDLYSTSLEQARTQYDEEAMTAFLVEQIRRFQPQVVVSHDFNGEYGHGYHMLTAEAVSLAVPAAADAGMYADSADKYGVWDTPKTYYHLYPENTIELDLRIPIDEMGGRTALEVAQDAYKMHVSQQWCWFYVSDEYEYSCAKFGLYRTNTGTDTYGGMLDNIKTYAEQESESLEQESIRWASEQASREQESLEQESLERARAESISEQESISESLRVSEAESRAEHERIQTAKRRRNSTIIAAVCVLAAIVVTFFLINRFYLRNNKKTEKAVRRKRR